MYLLADITWGINILSWTISPQCELLYTPPHTHTHTKGRYDYVHVSDCRWKNQFTQYLVLYLHSQSALPKDLLIFASFFQNVPLFPNFTKLFLTFPESFSVRVLASHPHPFTHLVHGQLCIGLLSHWRNRSLLRSCQFCTDHPINTAGYFAVGTFPSAFP